MAVASRRQTTESVLAIQVNTNHLIYVNGNSNISWKKLGGRSIRTWSLTIYGWQEERQTASRIIQTLAWISRQNHKATGFIVNKLSLACPGRMFCHICTQHCGGDQIKSNIYKYFFKLWTVCIMVKDIYSFTDSLIAWHNSRCWGYIASIRQWLIAHGVCILFW